MQNVCVSPLSCPASIPPQSLPLCVSLTNAPFQSICTDLWPWRQEAGQRDRGKEVAAEAKVTDLNNNVFVSPLQVLDVLTTFSEH